MDANRNEENKRKAERQKEENSHGFTGYEEELRGRICHAESQRKAQRGSRQRRRGGEWLIFFGCEGWDE